MKIFTLFFITAVISFTSCTNTNSDPKETLAAIINADNNADIQKVVSLYTNDAILLPSGKPNISGQEAIRKNYETIFSTSKMQLSADILETITLKNFTIIRGNTVGKIFLFKDSTTLTVNDKFLMVLKNAAGKWKIHRLMWSKNEN